MDRIEHYATLIDGWFWETDHEHRFTYLSDNVEKITGVRAEWHYGKSRMELRTRNIKDADWSRHLEILKAHEPFHDFRFKREGPDGISWVSTSGDPIFSPSGTFTGYRGVAKDITSIVNLSIEAEISKTRLINALDIIDEGFVYYDADDRLVLCNEKYRDYYPMIRNAIVPGVRFEDLIRTAADLGQFDGAIGRAEEWVAERMVIHNTGNTLVEQKLTDGRWLRITERKTPDGGLVGMRVDITKLKEAQEAAETANRTKSEFLATMSHELRTPLTSIKGSLGLINSLMSDTLPEGGQELFEIAIRNSNAMLLLVNELLDYEKIVSGTLVIDTHPCEIAALTSNVIRDNQGYASTQSVHFIFHKPEKLMFAKIHEHRFEQILRNLLSNAAKFSKSGSDIEISISSDKEQVSVYVKDTGPGIADEFKDKIFKPFTQIDSSTTRQSSGTGLGLSISRALAEGMGGSLGFETAVGVGSTFYISFPEIKAPPEGA